ncbi:WAT1-related protein [Camellia lanceoleosa]|uniref:WAT1-related protein n=1 Tax=Camellia lanceoleosa TaxID=1840588 RepID=A0ACC0G6T7_9ERIC|nr:WAT1-related protein [Camellia lanceoleosa]
MGMKEALPFLGMVSIQFIQVGMIVAVKEATSHGLTKFTFVFYSNSLAALILLPTSFLLHRSTRPPITFSLLCKFFVISLLGCTSQVIGNVAVQITPASFSTAIMNLVPGFTFTLAVIFRLEQADIKSSSTLAKSIGTIVSIVGALIVTLYKGPSLLMTATQYNLVLGAFLLTIECLSSSAYIITQAFLLTKFGAELIIVFFYCFFVAIMTGILSLVMERDPAAWSLLPSVKLLSILFSGIVGSAIQVSILLWCLRQRGPLFIAVFHPLGIVISTVVGIIVFGDILYLGSVVGSVIIVIGFYSVMWGKSKEQKVIKDEEETRSESPREKVPLLQNIIETQV